MSLSDCSSSSERSFNKLQEVYMLHTQDGVALYYLDLGMVV